MTIRVSTVHCLCGHAFTGLCRSACDTALRSGELHLVRGRLRPVNRRIARARIHGESSVGHAACLTRPHPARCGL